MAQVSACVQNARTPVTVDESQALNKLLINWLISVFFLLCAQSFVAAGQRVYEHSYDPARNPAEDLQLAIADASAENKKILLKLGGDWCSWCLLLDKFIAQSDAVRQIYNDTFVTVKVNVSEDNWNEDFLAQFPKANGYPFFLILDQSGKLIGAQETGVLEDGRGYSEQKFRDFVLKYRDS